MLTRNELDSIVELHLKMADPLILWPLIESKRHDLGFCDVLTDNDRLQENAWICNQMNRFIGKQKSQIYSKINDLDSVVEHLANIIEANKPDTTSRKNLIYSAIRNDWIETLAMYINQAIIEGEINE